MTTYATCSRTFLRLTLLCACVAAAVLAAPTRADAVEASPPAFVPNWDGATDATALTYRVERTGRVRVLVLGADGRTRRVLVDAVQRAGSHSTWWDGRDAKAQVLPSGRWIIRVEQVSPAAVRPAQRAGRAVAAKVAPDQTVVTLQEPAVAIRSVKLVNGSIGAAAGRDVARARVDLTAPATLSAAVVDGSGGVVRSLRSGLVRAGGTSVAWDGRGTDGRPVGDGSYTLLVAASGAGRPTNTIRTPMRVDRRAPTLVAKRAVRAKSSRTNVVVPVVVRVDEASTIAVRLGSRRITWKQAAGSRSVNLRGDLLGIAPAKRARTVRLLVLAADATGNARAAKVTVIVPAVVAPAPKPVRRPVVRRPTAPAPSPTKPVAAGKLRWPVVDIVTSEFGMRWGRPHQGLDINAPTGTAVYAAAAGTVLSAGTMDGYGIQVTLQHANGLTTRYAHFSATALGLVAGDGVSAGQLIGLSGCTGSCTGPHLHFETRVDGVAKNPRLFLG